MRRAWRPSTQHIRLLRRGHRTQKARELCGGRTKSPRPLRYSITSTVFYDLRADDDQLARAGFFYRPSSSSPDNTTCYLCGSSLDGWEENDDAVVEHLKHAPDCGWAVTIAIEQDVESGSYSLEDPMSERIVAARRMTFGSKWPHESKKGWVCKIKKV